MLYCVTEADPILLISNSVFNKVDAHRFFFLQSMLIFIYLHGVFNFFLSHYLTLMPLFKTSVVKRFTHEG